MKINNYTTSFVDTGPHKGPTLVFIHGFPLDHTQWQPQIDFFLNHVRCVAYDVRGHGKSHGGDSFWTVDDLVDDLHALITNLHLKKIILVGLSMGGYIALRALERFPKKFEGLILCDTRAEADANEGKLKRAQALKDVRINGAKPYVETAVQSLFFKDTFKQKPSLVENTLKVMKQTSNEGVKATLMALSCRMDMTAFLPQIKVPTLILVGIDDKITPVSVAKSMHKKIPHSLLKVIPNAAHLSNLEQPEIFNQYLFNFLIDNYLK